MIALNQLQLKFLSLLLDSGASAGEAETSRLKLLESLAKHGLTGHDIVKLVQTGSDSQEIAVRMSRPDYGLSVMPFGKSKGQLFMDLAPYDLRSAARWAMSTPELARKFAEFIHDVDRFLNQNA